MLLEKSFNKLFFLENILGIYRSFSTQTKVKKCLICTQIFVQITAHTILLYHELSYLSNKAYYDQMDFINSCYITSIYIISLLYINVTICYSSDFKSYFVNVFWVSRWFKDSQEFKSSVQKIYYCIVLLITFCSVLGVYRSIDMIPKVLPTTPLVFVLLLISQSSLRVTVLLQPITLFIFIMVVGILYKCLISKVCVVEECFGKYEENGQCEVITQEKIQGWVERYRRLAHCCEKVTLCFGRLYFMTILLSFLRYILLTYQFVYKYRFNKTRPTDYSRLIVIFTYLSVMMMPLAAAQLMNNQGVKFRRLLARLYNKMIGIDANAEETKMIKDFIRLIKKNPLQIKLISNFPAGMNFLPVIVMLFFNYLIVILQFNHVI